MKPAKSKRKEPRREPVKPLRAPPPTQEAKAELRADDDGMPPPPEERGPKA